MKKYKVALATTIILFVSVLLLFITALQHTPNKPNLNGLTERCAQAVTLLQQVSPSGNDHCAIRHWYKNTLKSIPHLLAQNNNSKSNLTKPSSIQQQALCAYTIRSQARLTARHAMPETEVALLRIRDLFTYGHFDGPEFEQLVNDKSNLAYKKVIDSSQRSHTQVDQACNL